MKGAMLSQKPGIAHTVVVNGHIIKRRALNAEVSGVGHLAVSSPKMSQTREAAQCSTGPRRRESDVRAHAAVDIIGEIPDSVITATDIDFLSQAAALSQASCAETQPHPNAACILVSPSGFRVAEASLWAQGTESPEVAAARAAAAAAAGGTAYLNLETGDCHGDAAGVQALLLSGVRRVVIGLRHPLPAQRGTAIDALRAAGVAVAVLGESPCSASAAALEAGDSAVLAANEPLLHVAAVGRPMGVLKYAMTLDGKIAASSGHSAWVSCADSRQEVFATRARSDAVIVGGQTVRRDNPRLTTRREGGHQPMRIVMSRTLDLPENAALWDVAVAPTIVATQRGARREFQKALRARGVEVLEFDFLTPGVVADYCRQRGFLSLLWECGGTLAAPAIADSAVHKVLAFVAPKIIGGNRAPTPVGELGFVEMTQALAVQQPQWRQTGTDLLLTGFLPASGGPRALAAELKLRDPLPTAESNGARPPSASTAGGAASAAAATVIAPAAQPFPHFAGFYKAWDRNGCFSNFSPHPVAMPAGPMTHLRLESFHPSAAAAAMKGEPIQCVWPSTEHYYQAQKFAGVAHPEAEALVEKIAQAPSPEAAAKLGRLHERTRPELLREDWGCAKTAAMHAALRAKFAAHEGPRAMLLETAPAGAVIVETAPHDYFWGRGVDGSGHNMLGKLLMRVREELVAEAAAAQAAGPLESEEEGSAAHAVA